MPWAPLHVHSQYSILDASAPIPSLVKRCKEFGIPAVALTDHGNLYGAVEFFKACTKEGIKPIIGCEVYVAPESRHEKKRSPGGRTSYHLGLLAKNDTGYHNLCKLSSIGYLEGFYYNPRIDSELLRTHSEGLICLSGCMSSRISQEILNGSREKVMELISWNQEVFGDDFYLEIQRHQMSEEDLQADGMYQETWLIQQYRDYIDKQTTLNDTLIDISKETGIPLVATNDSHYMDREDWRAHEILLNVQSGEPVEVWENDSLGNPKFRKQNPKRRTYSSHELYFKSPEQMAALFEDVPEALSNTLLVAEKCDVTFNFEKKHYPVYIPPSLEGKEYTAEERTGEVEQYLWHLCEEGIKNRYTPERLEQVQKVFPDQDPMEVVRARLNHEMSVIVPKEMCDYLLIVWDFIHWAKTEKIPVGPGRGSGAGSIVLYLIGVTDIEPLRFHLFFERFINPERISYPDIDVDICMARRSEVIHYTLEKYGKDNVAQIITFGTMKARSTIKDVGRVLSVPLAKVNALAKLVPEDLNITLEKALEKDADLRQMYREDEDAKRIMDIGQRLEGSIRSTGVHAAGLIISAEPLMNLIPVSNAKDSDIPVTQFSMKPVESIGMLKIDFLGLKTLTAIQMCVDEIGAKRGDVLDWVNLPLDDAPTFDLLNQGRTMGVFQLESPGMQDLARQLHLDKFEEIIAVGALYRPGPMDMIPTFISRKHGREKIEYDHAWMQEILAETYGIMVYQEQVMQIASRLAKYSLGEGDVLRRAMGKKDLQQMANEREKFRLGALENEIDEEKSMQIFDKMEKFAAYGFNKSHAAAYGYLSYVTSFLKANYPGQWLAALMTCDSSDISKVGKFIREAQAMQIPILSPDVNEAGVTFIATPEGIRFAMSAIKGVGEGVVEAIVKTREEGGAYTGLFDFIKRIDPRKVGKKIIECLVNAGCFDFTGWTRDALCQSIERMHATAMKEQKESEAGVMSLFTLMGETGEALFATPPEVANPSTKHALLLLEKELLGFFLTGHPMDKYRPVLDRLSCIALRKIETFDHGTVFRSAVIVEDVKVRVAAKSQRKFAIVIISDGIVSYEVPVWPELFEEKSHLLIENQLLYAVLQVDRQEEGLRLSCQWFDDLTKADEQMIIACDNAYDKAKQQRFWASKRKKKEEKVVQIVEKETSNVVVKLDASKARLSHILELKRLFEENRGQTPVQIQFLAEDSPLATLHIDTKWGVEPTAKLHEQLKRIEGSSL